jgi:PKD repeat protein
MFRLLCTTFILPLCLMAGEMDVSTASYLGTAVSSDAVRGVRILSDGDVLLAANLDTALSAANTRLLNGATASTSGALVRLSSDGRTVRWVVRFAAAVYDLAIDDSDAAYVAAGTDGVCKISADGQMLVWRHLAGTYVHRVDVSGGGECVCLAPSSAPSNADEAPGAGVIQRVLPDGTLGSSFAGRQNTLDICIDAASQTIVIIGFRQASAWGPPQEASAYLPVQIAYARGLDYTGALKWSDYEWSANTGYDSATDSFVPGANDDAQGVTDQAKLDPRFLNRLANQMADTRGMRACIGDDGLLYMGFEAAGGNHIFRQSPVDLGAFGSIVGGDFFHQFTNTGSSHKTYVGRYAPSTGVLILGQQYATVIKSGATPSANALRLKAGDLSADASGRLCVAGASAYGLPMWPNIYHAPQPGLATFNPFSVSDYLGGAFVIIMSADFSRRLYCTRLATGGTTHGCDMRLLPGQSEARIAFGGSATLSAGPAYTQDAIQPSPGYGSQDGHYAVLGGSAAAGGAARAMLSYGGVSYTGTAKPKLRGNDGINTSGLDHDGDGADDSRREYLYSSTQPLSPVSSYTGPAFYGGLRNLCRDSANKSFDENTVSGSQISIRIQPTAPVACKQHGIFFFDRAAFTGITATDALSFDKRSLVFCDSATGRWVVRQNGVFYVSEDLIADSATLSFERDDDDGRWAIWRPELDIDFDAASAAFANRNFTHIDAVGFMIDFDTFSSARFWLKWSRFTADLAINSSGNTAPQPSFTLTPARGPSPLSVSFDATPSSDPDGGVTFYTWAFGDGAQTSGPTTSNSYTAAGRYTPSLRVWDGTLTNISSTGRVEVTSRLGGSPTRTLAAFGGTMGSATFLRQATLSVLDYDGDGPDDFRKEIPFDPALPIMDDAIVKGTLWSGGLVTRDYNAASAWSDARVDNASFNWRVQPQTSSPVTMHAALFIDRAQFLNRGDQRPVRFGAGSQFRLTGISRWEQLGQVRWLVRDGSQYYVSQTTLTPSSGSVIYSIPSENDDGSWALYTPASDLNFDASTASYLTRNFSQITAVGLIIDNDSPNASRHWIQFTDFEVIADITADNTAPSAQITPTQAYSDRFQTLQLTAAGSSSSGQIVSYEWDFGDGGTTTGPSATYQYSTRGPKNIVLTVTDDLGQRRNQTLEYITGPSFSTWAAEQSVSADPDADLDQDGAPHVIEYFQSTAPQQSGGSTLLLSGGWLEFRQSKQAPQSRWQLFRSSDLRTWQPFLPLESQRQDPGPHWLHRLRLPSTPAFYRLDIGLQ